MENINLLLVDDEDGYRNILSKRLLKRGFNLLQAESGEKCLQIIKANKNKIDIVVLDIKMSGLSGIETLKQIREKPLDLEVILLTGHSSTINGVEGIKAGAFDYLSKPVEIDHLVSKIKQAFNKLLWTKEKRKEKKLKLKMEEQMIATERLASLGILSTGIAHEINNPLAIISEAAGFMKLILEKKEMSLIPRLNDLNKALNKIEIGVNRASKITHKLLGFVKKQTAAISKIDLKLLIDETLELIISDIKTKDLKIEKKMDISTDTIWSDPYEIRQVLLNLFSNAVHASKKNGTIILALENSGNNIIFTIQDFGYGILKENFKKIFEPFFTTKDVNKGTGLGLFISRGIMEKLGGNIEVDSKVGIETIFKITFPKVNVFDNTTNKESNLWATVLNKIKEEAEI